MHYSNFIFVAVIWTFLQFIFSFVTQTSPPEGGQQHPSEVLAKLGEDEMCSHIHTMTTNEPSRLGESLDSFIIACKSQVSRGEDAT